MITVGSLFSGIGGLELGLERAGMRVVWQVEKDDYCRRVLAKHWPEVERFEDVKEVGAHNLKPVDLICGGFPCQDISSAGKRAGIRGERSGLWSEYRRIICELRPRFVLVENVAMLLADGMGVVLGELAESGYDAEWDCIPAAAVGAPHRRDRVFIIAYPRSCGRREKERDIRRWQSDATRSGSANVADTDSGRRIGPRTAQGPSDARADRWDDTGWRSPILADAQRRGRKGRVQQCTDPTAKFASPRSRNRGGDRLWRAWELEPEVGRVAHGVPARLVAPALRALGNAVVPQVSEYIGRLIVEADRENEAVA